MLQTLCDEVVNELNDALKGLCFVTANQHEAAARLDQNKPVITVNEGAFNVTDSVMNGTYCDGTLEITAIHPHNEDSSVARAFFSEILPPLVHIGAKNFEPVYIPIRNEPYPAMQTSLIRTFKIGDLP